MVFTRMYRNGVHEDVQEWCSQGCTGMVFTRMYRNGVHKDVQEWCSQGCTGMVFTGMYRNGVHKDVQEWCSQGCTGMVFTRMYMNGVHEDVWLLDYLMCMCIQYISTLSYILMCFMKDNRKKRPWCMNALVFVSHKLILLLLSARPQLQVQSHKIKFKFKKNWILYMPHGSEAQPL